MPGSESEQSRDRPNVRPDATQPSTADAEGARVSYADRQIGGTSGSRQSEAISGSRQSRATSGPRQSGGSSGSRQSGAISGSRQSRATSGPRQSGGSSGSRQSGAISGSRQSRATSGPRQSGGTSGPRQSRSYSRQSRAYNRQSRIYSGGRDVEFNYFIPRNEPEYPVWWTRSRLLQEFYSLSEDPLWIAYICFMVLMGIIWFAMGLNHPIFEMLDLLYNVSYTIHVVGLASNMLAHKETISATKSGGFLVDIATFAHFFSSNQNFKMLCYYLRLHRPFSYLWALNDYNLKGSVLGTTLKYCYIFLVMRVTWALVWLSMNELEQMLRNKALWSRAMEDIHHKARALKLNNTIQDTRAMAFLSAVYLVDKMFIPFGPPVPPANDLERVICLLIMLSGCFAVTAAAVASLTLVVSLYLRPEEAFRARYRLIIKEMKDSRIPPSQREKVKTFYKMYWHKQRAVSETQLMPTFPPTLPATILTDIYFEATQKCPVLQDLSYQFLSELARKMETIHYIPGDAIIRRQSKKSSINYITYGDVEMVTAEDDSTAILRMTRGTALTQCGVCAPAGLGTAHLEVRAASFCTAHVLNAQTLWRVAMKHGKLEAATALILGAYYDHMERVKTHFQTKVKDEVKHKSSILHFKRCLMALKEAKDANGLLLLARTDVFLEIAKCYIMRNRADAALTDEADAICLRPTFPCILQPASSLLIAWHYFVACLILAVCFVHPYYLVYTKEVPVEFRFFDYLVTGVYVLDLVAHLSTGANVEEGVAITFSQTSSQQVHCHWFVLDVLATAPIFEFIGDGHFAGINKILRLPKVFCVLKKLEDSTVYHSNILRLMSYTLMVLMACYLIAAFQQGFMCFQFGYCLVTNLTHSPYWENKPLDDETVEKRLSFALYWAIHMISFTCHMQTLGTENWNNVLYTLLVLEICIVLRIFMEAAYSATILVTTALREDYDASILIVKNFLTRNHVDPVLSDRFISYLQLCWYTDKAYSMTNTKSIFYDLPPHVYHDIVAKQRSKYILAIPLMKFASKADLKDISIAAKLFYTPPNEIILNTGDMSNEMYVIKQGICEILSPDTKRVVGFLNTKCHFGVLVCLMRVPSLYTIRTVTNVHLFSISRKYLNNIIALPQIKEAMNYIKHQPEYKSIQVRREPFISYEVPDPIPNMERFKLPRKYEQDSAFRQPFYRLGFLSILRYIFPRFTIRPDGRYIKRYEWFRAFCAFTSAMVYPGLVYLKIQWNSELYYLAWLLDLTAVFDIFQRFLVGYYNTDGILVSHPVSTAAHYLKGAFFVDLFGCAPLGILDSDHYEKGKRSRVSTIGQLLILNRLMQLYRLPSAMQIFRSFIDRRDILTVFKAIPMLIVLLNVMTCFVVLYSAKIYYYEESDELRWMIVPIKDEGGSWIDLFQHRFRFNITESPTNLHMATYFWMAYEITTTGYNIIKPSNVQLIRILFLGMLFGSMMITYFSVRIISIRANVNKALAEFQEHLKDMIYYMRREKLNLQLQKDVLDYYEYNWDKMGGVNYRNMFKLCDLISLRTDAILHIYGPTFAKCQILSQSDAALLRIVGRAVQSGYFLRGMNIIEADDVTGTMFFVDYGEVDAYEVINDEATITKLSRGSVFGNLEGLATVRCPITFAATSRLHLLMIKSQTFYNILRDFSTSVAFMRKFLPKHNKNYIPGNAADASQVDEQNNVSAGLMVVTKRSSIIKHLYFKDKYLQLYLIIISLICVYLDVYNAGFQDNRMYLLVVLYVLDVCFCMKILILFTIPLIVESVNIRTIILPTRKKYFDGEFRYDLKSCIPIELLCLLSQHHLWFWFSILRLNRMFRIVTVYNCLQRHKERITVNLVLSTIAAASIWFTLFVHTTSCIWYFIGRLEDEKEPRSSWVWKDDGTSWCENEYICSLYFVLTTFIQNGVGDIMPKKKSEIMFVSILAIISTMICMILVGEFSNIIQYRYFRFFSFYSNYLELQEFMKNNRVSKNLVTLVNKYSLHLWRETRGMQAPHLLLTAPTALRLRIMSAAYLHHLTRHHIFKDCEPAFLRQLVGCLELLTFSEDMYVVKFSEITDSMYFIHTGKIEESADATHEVPKVYPAGSYFGVLQGMARDFPYTHSYRTLIKSQVLTLRLDDWLYLLKHYPESRDIINQHMKYDDASRDSSAGSDDSWSSKKPKPRPPRQPRPTLVTDLVDKNPPAPLDLSPQDGGIGEGVDEPERTSRSNLSMGLHRSNGNFNLVTLQHGLGPTTTMDQAKNDSSDAGKDTAEKRSEGSKVTDKSSASQLSTVSSKQGPKYLEELTSASTPFFAKVGEKAKRIMSIAKEDVLYALSDEVSEKDVLLYQEEEEATAALMKEIDKADNVKMSITDVAETIQQYVSDDVGSKTADNNEKKVEENVTGEIRNTIKTTEKLMVNDDAIKDEETENKQLMVTDNMTKIDSTKDIDRSDTNLTQLATTTTILPQSTEDVQSDISIVRPVMDTNSPPHSTRDIDLSDTNLNRSVTAVTIFSHSKDDDQSESTTVETETNPNILQDNSNILSQQTNMQTNQKTELTTGPATILKEGKVEKFDKRMQEIDDEFMASTSKDIDKDRRLTDETKDEATTLKPRRSIRVRYEEDKEDKEHKKHKKKDKKHSISADPYAQHSLRVADTSSTDRDVSLLDSDATVRSVKDDKVTTPVGSNTSVAQSISSTSSTQSFKRKKFKYSP